MIGFQPESNLKANKTCTNVPPTHYTSVHFPTVQVHAYDGEIVFFLKLFRIFTKKDDKGVEPAFHIETDLSGDRVYCCLVMLMYSAGDQD